MTQPDRITLVLRACEAMPLSRILPLVKLGELVSVGPGLAVIAGASEGDLQWELERALHKAGGAPQLVAVHTPWNDKQVLDFLSVALRHVVVEGNLQHSDINEALRYMAEKGEPAFCKGFDIDEHVRMAADGRRYRWLRDYASSSPSGFTPAVFDKAGGITTLRGCDDLDERVDAAIRHLTEVQGVQVKPL
ncbi:hypothetical protein ACIPZC_24245 [Pseudomonas sp. NPDC089743]|uniref:hypothetical protein n=1 Tax=Pseudomonas sp. NPDC089743 TaxID=3364471 RepID=UPI0038002B7A